MKKDKIETKGKAVEVRDDEDYYAGKNDYAKEKDNLMFKKIMTLRDDAGSAKKRGFWRSLADSIMCLGYQCFAILSIERHNREDIVEIKKMLEDISAKLGK